MPEPQTPPGTPPQPPARSRGFSSPEGRLASAVQRLVAILRNYPHAFPVKYDELKPALWGSLAEARRLDVFASDFFDDLLELANHPLAAPDRKPAHEERLREVASLAALRRLQAGDVQDGIARVRRLAGVTSGSPVTWPTTVAPEAALEPATLRALAASLATTEPETAAAVEELVPLLERDPTFVSGPSIGMLVHLSSGDPRLHPGYGLWMMLRCRGEALDRRGTTTFSLNRRVLEADSPLQKALAAADGVSRSSRGPRLDRGLQLHLEADGLEEFVTGESADLAFALLFASEGRSAASRRQLVLHPGSAAIGEITRDGVVREVAAGPMRSKLRRVWESGVRRLYVAAGQKGLCREILAGFGAATATEVPPTDSESLAPSASSGDASVRWVGIIPAERLEDVALPHHFISEKRRLTDYIPRLVRRNRLQVEIGSAVVAAVLVVLGYLYLPSNPRSIVVSGDTVTATYTSAKSKTVRLVSGRGYLRILRPDSTAVMSGESSRDRRYCWLDDVNGDGKNEVVAVCLISEKPDTDTGTVRIQCLSSSLDTLWFRDVKADIRFGDASQSPTVNEMRLRQASFEDWNGDGRKDVMVALTNRNFPSVVTIWDGHGACLLQYVHAGHVRSYCLVPAPFVLADTCRAPEGFQGDWRQRSCLVGLAYYAYSDSGSALFAIPPWVTSASSPPVTPRRRHVSLPPHEGPYVVIPPSLVALTLNQGRSHPDRVEYLTEPQPYLKVGTIEKPTDRAAGKPAVTLIREFGPGFVQTRVSATDELFTAIRGTIPRDDPELARSVETVRYREHGRWVWRRLPAW